MTAQQDRQEGARGLRQLAAWEHLIAGLSTALIVTDAHGRIVLWNQSATGLFGWNRDDALGRSALKLLVAPASEIDAISSLTAIAAGKPWNGNITWRHRSGDALSLEARVHALDDGQGNTGFVIEAWQQRREEADNSETEQMYQTLLANAAEVVCVTDVNGIVKLVVQPDSTSLGYATEEVVGRVEFAMIHPDDVGQLRASFKAVVDQPDSHPNVVYRAQAHDGSWRWRQARLSNHLADPAVDGIVCNISDITNMQTMLNELRSAEARQSAILDRSRDATMFFDPDGTIRWASASTQALLGVEPYELIGKNGLDFIHRLDRERAFAEFATMNALGDHVRIEFRAHVNGSIRWLEEDVTNHLDDPDVGYIVANVRDITDRKVADEQLARMSLYDGLTGLPNRVLLEDRLSQLFSRGNSAALLYLDLDNFGVVNDSLSRGVGDELLRLVALRLAAAAKRRPSTLARVGGDEFVLLCDGVRDAPTAVNYAESLLESLRQPFVVDGHELFVGASVGVSLSPGSSAALMRNATIAMHKSKTQGRGRVSVFDASLDTTQQRRLAVQGDLRHALQRDEIIAWYQPMIDLQNGQVSGVEALARWDHPEYGILTPDRFIEIAEMSGLIRPLGAQVFHRALHDVRRWNQQGLRLHVSVNVAAAQLNDLDLIEEIETALVMHSIDPGQITIEITETAAMQIDSCLESLHRIRTLGMHLALDDFGTGYSSLSFLRELPIDAIKIDRSFVSELDSNDRDLSIVKGVLAIADALEHPVVAEGVETAAQAEMLRQLGCEYAQGFLWSRPVPADDVRMIVNQINTAADR